MAIGKITFSTALDNAGVAKDAKQLQSSLQGVANAIKRAFGAADGTEALRSRLEQTRAAMQPIEAEMTGIETKAQAAGAGAAKAFEKAVQTVQRLQAESNTLQEKLDAYAMHKQADFIPQDAPHAQEVLGGLLDQDATYQKMLAQYDSLDKKLLETQRRMRALNSAAQDSTGTSGERYRQLESELEKLKQEAEECTASLNKVSGAAGGTSAAAKSASKGMGATAQATRGAMAGMRAETGRYGQAAGQAAGQATGAFARMGSAVKGFFTVSLLMTGIRGAINSLRDGFAALAASNSGVNSAMTSMQSSMMMLRNSVVSAFAPALEAIAPIFNTIANAAIAAANAVAMFIAKISGKSTYIRATRAATGYAGGVGSAGGAAKKAAENVEELDKATNQLGIDELNTVSEMQSKKPSTPSGGGGGGGGGGGAGGGGFEEVPIDSAFSDAMDALIAKAKELFDIFKAGFEIGFNGTTLDALIEHMKSVGASLREIFTDPAVVGAANAWLENFVLSLGKIAGSVASIGVSIAEFLLGSIDLFLQQNTQRIKDRIVSLFEVQTDIDTIIADFCVAVGRLFEVFRTPEAKQIGADLITLFYEACSGAYLLLETYARDLLSVIIAPITNSADALKSGLESLLLPIADFTRAASEKMGQFVDFCTQLYNAVLSPALSGLGEDLARFWQSLGRLIDAIVELLRPAFAWISEVFVQGIASKLEWLWTAITVGATVIAWVIRFVVSALTEIMDFITNIFSINWALEWENVKLVFQAAWDAIVLWVTQAWIWIQTIVAEGLEAIRIWIAEKLQSITQFFIDAWTRVSNVTSETWNGIKKFFSDVWEAILKKASEVLVSLGDKFRDAFNGLVEIIRNPVNKIIDIVNGMIDGIVSGVNSIISSINGIGFTIPEWVPGFGGKNFSINIPTLSGFHIPHLAQGAVIPANREFLSVLGDQRSGRNLEAPEGLIRQIVREESGSRGFQAEQPLELSLDGDVFYRAMMRIKENRGVEISGAFAHAY